MNHMTLYLLCLLIQAFATDRSLETNMCFATREGLIVVDFEVASPAQEVLSPTKKLRRLMYKSRRDVGIVLAAVRSCIEFIVLC